MGPKCLSSITGWYMSNKSLKHRTSGNSFTEWALDLRQEIDPPLSLLHAVVGSVESKVCGAEQSPFSQLAGKPQACFTYSSRGNRENEGLPSE